jgi:hypothetical protein
MESLSKLFLLSLLAVACTNSPINQVDVPFVNPPLDGVDVPYSDYAVVAERGDTIFYPSGSIIVLPSNAFVDKDGKEVTGKVDVSYREFADPVDFFLAGISMAYDSANVRYIFESSGMCEILASQNGQPLYVNQAAKPQVNLVSPTSNPMHNVYYLDQEKRQWVVQGKDIVSDFTFGPESEGQPQSDFVSLPPEPVMPAKPSGTRPSFSIIVEPGSLPELEVYNQLKFEVAPEDMNYSPDYGAIQWENVDVKRGRRQGTYDVTFSKTDLSVTFIALPVVDESHYAAAMDTYRQKKSEREELVAKQIEANRKQMVENAIVSAKNEALGTLVALRNSLIDDENREALKAKLAQQKEQLAKLGGNLGEAEQLEKDIARWEEEIRRANELAKARREESSARQLIYRTFRIDGFGIWNCDNPCLLASNGAVKIDARFVDENYDDLALPSVEAAFGTFNGIYTNTLLPRSDSPDFIVIPQQDNMFFAVYNQQLYYLTYSDFKLYNIKENEAVVFKMRTSAEPIKSVEDVRRIMGL